jgi:hypothetical protein
MYAPTPRSYWVDSDAGEVHIIDSYGEPGPVVRKPLCEDTQYQALVDGETEIPVGVWVEERNEQLDTERFHGVDPAESIRREVCSACRECYLELLWRRPADYPALEVEVETPETEETYMVTDVHFVSDDCLSPQVQIVDELGRTKKFRMKIVTEIIPHKEMPVVY